MHEKQTELLSNPIFQRFFIITAKYRKKDLIFFFCVDKIGILFLFTRSWKMVIFYLFLQNDSHFSTHWKVLHLKILLTSQQKWPKLWYLENLGTLIYVQLAQKRWQTWHHLFIVLAPRTFILFVKVLKVYFLDPRNWAKTEQKSSKNRAKAESKLNKNWAKTEQKLSKNWEIPEQKPRKSWVNIEQKLSKNWAKTELKLS